MKQRSYQISIRDGKFEVLVFHADSYANKGVLPGVRDLDQALAKVNAWIHEYHWGAGPCRLRDVDSDEWRELGVVGAD